MTQSNIYCIRIYSTVLTKFTPAAHSVSPANALISRQALSFIEESRTKERCKEKWQQSGQISYKNTYNNSPSMNTDADLKLSSDGGMIPNNCLTL